MHAPLSILPLEVEGLGYAVNGTPLLDGLSFRVERGDSLFVLGPNGAGKSLLLRLCHGLLRPSGGTIRWLGGGGAARPGGHAMVFQQPVLLRRSAAANIRHALALAGVPRDRRRREAEDALRRFHLEHLAERPARVLSGGEKQRLAMARAWALRPELLFLDEPTTALDPAATKAIEEMIGAFHEGGTTLVMTTHDLGQARRLARRVLFLHHGRILEDTPAPVFFRSPRTREAGAFLAGELVY